MFYGCMPITICTPQCTNKVLHVAGAQHRYVTSDMSPGYNRVKVITRAHTRCACFVTIAQHNAHNKHLPLNVKVHHQVLQATAENNT